MKIEKHVNGLLNFSIPPPSYAYFQLAETSELTRAGIHEMLLPFGKTKKEVDIQIVSKNNVRFIFSDFCIYDLGKMAYIIFREMENAGISKYSVFQSYNNSIPWTAIVLLIGKKEGGENDA